MKRKKRHLNKKKVFNLLLIIFIISFTTYFILNIRVKSVLISGNNYISDASIIRSTNLRDYPLYRDISNKELINNIKSLPLISDVKIRRSILGNIKIIVEEEQPLLYFNNQVITDKLNKYDITNLNLPTLKKEIENSVLEILVNALKKLDYSVYDSISEIEYSPTLSTDGSIIDDKRFTFYMKDGNIAYINTINIDKFDYYLEVVNKTNSTYKEYVIGEYFFDSGTSNVVFSKKESSVDEESAEEEL